MTRTSKWTSGWFFLVGNVLVGSAVSSVSLVRAGGFTGGNGGKGTGLWDKYCLGMTGKVWRGILVPGFLSCWLSNACLAWINKRSIASCCSAGNVSHEGTLGGKGTLSICVFHQEAIHDKIHLATKWRVPFSTFLAWSHRLAAAVWPKAWAMSSQRSRCFSFLLALLDEVFNDWDAGTVDFGRFSLGLSSRTVRGPRNGV